MKKDVETALKDARLAALTPKLDPKELKKVLETVNNINLQLDWHCDFDPHVLKKSTLKRKANELQAFIEGVNHLNSGEIKVPKENEKMSESEGDSGEADEYVDITIQIWSK